VAHGCFWRLHPARAFAWELRLGAEIRPDFTIDEADSDACRTRWFAEETARALEAVEKELTRRNRKRRGDAKDDDAEDDDAGSAKEAPRTLRVAKGTLWAHAPREVFALELRWRAVLGETFAVEEPGHEEHRARWEAEHADEARALRAKAVVQGALGDLLAFHHGVLFAPGAAVTIVGQHAAIRDAIASRDPGLAERLMREHLEWVLAHYPDGVPGED
jgi:hypothetical protein